MKKLKGVMRDHPKKTGLKTPKIDPVFIFLYCILTEIGIFSNTTELTLSLDEESNQNFSLKHTPFHTCECCTQKVLKSPFLKINFSITEITFCFIFYEF